MKGIGDRHRRFARGLGTRWGRRVRAPHLAHIVRVVRPIGVSFAPAAPMAVHVHREAPTQHHVKLRVKLACTIHQPSVSTTAEPTTVRIERFHSDTRTLRTEALREIARSTTLELRTSDTRPAIRWQRLSPPEPTSGPPHSASPPGRIDSTHHATPAVPRIVQRAASAPSSADSAPPGSPSVPAPVPSSAPAARSATPAPARVDELSRGEVDRLARKVLDAIDARVIARRERLGGSF